MYEKTLLTNKDGEYDVLLKGNSMIQCTKPIGSVSDTVVCSVEWTVYDLFSLKTVESPGLKNDDQIFDRFRNIYLLGKIIIAHRNAHRSSKLYDDFTLGDVNRPLKSSAQNTDFVHNALSPVRRQAITWINTGLLLIEPLGTICSEIWIKIQNL